MKVILKETISSLGMIGAEVNVAPGYARNYLFPQKKAVQATSENLQLVAQLKVKYDLQIAKEKELAQEMAAKLEGVSVAIAVKVSDENHLYGSVTTREILDALTAKGFEIDKKMLLLVEPIKALGTYKVPIRVYKGIEPEITVEIVAE